MNVILRSVQRLFKWFLIVLLGACSGSKETLELDSPVEYSFFVAGHVYGSTENYQGGLYDPFMDYVDSLNNDPNMDMGFLAGDIVKHSEFKYWSMVDQDLENFQFQIRAAPGNHDLDSNTFFVDRFEGLYKTVSYNRDLFLVLDGNNGWNISGAQKDFILDAVHNHDPKSGNIFVISHQLIWKGHERYETIGVNSHEGMADTLTFWEELAPTFQALDCQTYFFAGDVGAFDWATPVFYDEMDNLTFIATGMGGGVKDNFIIVDVHENKEVSFRLISLDPSKNLGPLEDY